MSTKKSVILSGIILMISFFVIAISTSSQGVETRLEMQNEITLPEYQNDLGRIINAYERIVDRLMYMTERNFEGLGVGVQQSNEKLASIEARIADLSARISRIERALGIATTKPQIGNTNDANSN